MLNAKREPIAKRRVAVALVGSGNNSRLGTSYLSAGSSASRLPDENWRFTMNAFALKIKRFLESEDGPTAVEYAVMLALIVVVCLTTIQSLGTNANATFQKVSTSIQTANS